MNRDSTCPVCCLLIQFDKRCIIYTRYKFGLFGNPKASDEDRTRDTNLEGWDVTATPHSQGICLLYNKLPVFVKYFQSFISKNVIVHIFKDLRWHCNHLSSIIPRPHCSLHTSDRSRKNLCGTSMNTIQFRNCLLYTSPSPRD